MSAQRLAAHTVNPRTITADIADYRHQSGASTGVLVAFPGAHAGIPDSLRTAVLRRGDSSHTRRAYALDLRTYADWLSGEGIPWDGVTPDDLDRYREWLSERYARTTANRRLSTIRSLYREAARRGLVGIDPAADLRSLRGRSEGGGRCLSRAQAQGLIEHLRADTRRGSRLRAVRDLALVGLLLRTGIRRAELVSLRVADLGTSGGHDVLSIRGKGNVRRTVKVPTDVLADLRDWLRARCTAGPEPAGEAPLFVAISKGGKHVSAAAISGRAIHGIVGGRLLEAGCPALGPHALRATFATLALEGGASLYRIQSALGHADPRTTEVYLRSADELSDNAVDYVRL